ncbi:hypothetical protein K6H11_004560 [Candida tropicalis]
MLRIFRVHHKKELTIQDPRLMYIDVTKDTNIKQEYIKKKVPKMRDSPFPLYLENYVLWNESGLIMKSIKNDDEITVEEQELPKAFYGYYETRDVPVVAFYLNEDELEFLKSRNKASNVRYEFFDEDGPGKGLVRWLLFPGRIEMGLHYVSTFALRMQDIEEEPRMFYFTENDRLFCGTGSMGFSTIEVKDILDCPRSQYDISEKVYNFDTRRDRAMFASKVETKDLAKHLGVPLKFLDQIIMPE